MVSLDSHHKIKVVKVRMSKAVALDALLAQNLEETFELNEKP